MISVLAIGGVIYQVANQTLLEHVKSSLLYHAEFREDRIINLFEQQKAWMQKIADSAATKHSAEALFDRYHQGVESVEYQQARDTFREEYQLLLNTEEVKDLFLLTIEGELAFSLRSMEGELGVNLSTDGFYGQTILSDLIEQVVQQKRMAVSQYGKIDQVEDATVLMGVPIFSSFPGQEDQIMGIMVRPFSLVRLRDLLKSYSGLGETGEVMIAQWRNGVGSEVNFINHFRNHLQRGPSASCLTLRRNTPEKFPMMHALNYERGSGWVLDNSCNPVFAVWAWIPKLQLGMVVKQDRSEILLPLERLEREILIAGLAVLLFLIWVIRRQAHVMVRPIEELTNATAHGAFEQLEHGTIREVNDLAEALKERTDGLEQARRETELILESMDEGLVVVDQEGKIERGNPKFAHLRGESPEGLIGRAIGDLLKQGHQGKTEEAHQLLCVDGSTIPVSIARATLEVALKGHNGEVLVLHDLRALLKAERAMQANKAKDDFLASMSHELRTPLTAIIGNSEMLIAGVMKKLSNQQQEMLRSIEIAGRIQLALVNDILDLSKIEAGKLQVDQVNFDLHVLLNEIEHIFSKRADDSGINFQVRRELPLTHQLVGDSRRIGQILSNLLGNAIKFTEEGDVTLTVLLDKAEQMLHFVVKDEGIGIAQPMIKRLFQPFEQADHTISHRFGGTGLGLHISCTLAEMMEGEITVESILGEGSTFELLLPYRESVIVLDQKHHLSDAEAHQQQFSGKVLLAEDTPELQTIVTFILESFGVTVTLAKNGQEAVAFASKQPFDLILMDMRMPIMDGIEATQILRGRGYKKPIIAHTANVMKKHLEQFVQAGSDDVLAKPIDQNELRRILKKYLSPIESPVKESPVEKSTVQELPKPAAVAAAEFEVSDELRQIFIDRLQELVVVLRQSLSAQKWDQLHDAAHAIKGSGTLYDQPQLTHAGKVVCDALDAENLDHIDQQVQHLLEEVNAVL